MQISELLMCMCITVHNCHIQQSSSDNLLFEPHCLQFGKQFHREFPLFLEIHEFPYNMVQHSQQMSMSLPADVNVTKTCWLDHMSHKMLHVPDKGMALSTAANSWSVLPARDMTNLHLNVLKSDNICYMVTQVEHFSKFTGTRCIT